MSEKTWKIIFKVTKILVYLTLVAVSFERGLNTAGYQPDFVTSPEQVVNVWLILMIAGIVGLFLELYLSKNEK